MCSPDPQEKGPQTAVGITWVFPESLQSIPWGLSGEPGRAEGSSISLDTVLSQGLQLCIRSPPGHHGKLRLIGKWQVGIRNMIAPASDLVSPGGATGSHTPCSSSGHGVTFGVFWCPVWRAHSSFAQDLALSRPPGCSHQLLQGKAPIAHLSDHCCEETLFSSPGDLPDVWLLCSWFQPFTSWPGRHDLSLRILGGGQRPARNASPSCSHTPGPGRLRAPYCSRKKKILFWHLRTQ